MGMDAHPFSIGKCESYKVRRPKKLPGRQFLDKNQLVPVQNGPELILG